MLDTNILISAALFPNERIDGIIVFIATEHELVLSDFIIEELIEGSLNFKERNILADAGIKTDLRTVV
jgi:predicted nucleic acid-binding protein